MKYLDITVTEDDIFWGKPENPRECPVARAVKRMYPMAAHRVDVGFSVISVGDAIYFASGNLNMQIHSFDEKGVMKPGTYRAFDTPPIRNQ